MKAEVRAPHAITRSPVVDLIIQETPAPAAAEGAATETAPVRHLRESLLNVIVD